MKRATKTALRQEIDELRHVGAQFANIAFNLCQTQDPMRVPWSTMDELRREWDAIKRREQVGDKA